MICILNTCAQAQEATQYEAKTLSEGLYLARWWDIGESPLSPLLGEDVTKFTKTGADVYEGQLSIESCILTGNCCSCLDSRKR